MNKKIITFAISALMLGTLATGVSKTAFASENLTAEQQTIKIKVSEDPKAWKKVNIKLMASEDPKAWK